MSELSQTDSADYLDGIVKPAIYSRQAIVSFSVFFSPLFGGILLMQNLKDINKKKEANLVLILSLLMSVVIVLLLTFFEIKNRSAGIICNVAGAAVLTQYFFKKYFPDEADYEKKKIWKPLIIGIVLVIALVALIVAGGEKVD